MIERTDSDTMETPVILDQHEARQANRMEAKSDIQTRRRARRNPKTEAPGEAVEESKSEKYPGLSHQCSNRRSRGSKPKTQGFTEIR